MRRRRRGFEVFSMSFLDVVSCGFGAIILLLVVSRHAEPLVIERLRADLSGTVASLSSRLDVLHERERRAGEALRGARAALQAQRAALDALSADLADARSRLDDARHDRQAQVVIGERLAEARQTLSEEMRRLLGSGYRRAPSDATIGGVPVDSRYVAFIIDTSGSMTRYAWPLVLSKLEETLAVYPRLQGIQVMNDMGQYMFSGFAGRWIPDTPARRKAITTRLRTWRPFSNSSPVEGITEAIRRLHAAGERISLYVFGDEFSGASLEAVAREVDRINRADAQGRRRVRIHAVGFPTQFAPGASGETGIRFAALMRVLTQRNGGAFVGLASASE
jgi:hypothetical protein